MKDYFKVVMIGDGSVGKTSLRNQFLSGKFSPSYTATIGADFITKTLPSDPSSPSSPLVQLSIWDTAGQERFRSLGAAFYRGADACILVFDASRPETLQNIRAWFEEFKMRTPIAEEKVRSFCWVAVGNKSDLRDKYQGTRTIDARTGKERVVVSKEAARQVLDEMMPPRRKRRAARAANAADVGDSEEEANSEELESIFARDRHQRSAGTLTSANGNGEPAHGSSAERATTNDGENADTDGIQSSASSSKRQSIIRSIDIFPPQPTSTLPSIPSGGPPPSSSVVSTSSTTTRSSMATITGGGLSPPPASSFSSAAPAHLRTPRTRLSSNATSASIYHTPTNSFFVGSQTIGDGLPLFGGRTTPGTGKSVGGSAMEGDDGEESIVLDRLPSGDPIPFPSGPVDEDEVREEDVTPAEDATTHTPALTPTAAASGVSTITNGRHCLRSGSPSPPPSPPQERRRPPGTAARRRLVDGMWDDDGSMPLFFASARTGEGVAEIFQHVASRVAQLREWEAAVARAEAEGWWGGAKHGYGVGRGWDPSEGDPAGEDAVRRAIRLSDGKSAERMRGWRRCCS